MNNERRIIELPMEGIVTELERWKVLQKPEFVKMNVVILENQCGKKNKKKIGGVEKRK